MKSAIAALVTGLATATLALAPAAQAKPKLTGEEQLAKMLEGRTAGKPVNCIPYSRTNDATVIKKTAIVYRSGSTLYVNRPTNADLLDDDDILVTRLWGSQLCSVDTIQLHDRMSPSMWRGFVGLREFVPYRKGK
ncbi:hypothetical protein MTR62_05180 [Novosphingobium sp. 1949]|uniref:Uncharacterized protein n=1 Tax=Novosphingobium organovorum TaxID=2930092 RepID=A0ABT0BAK1_9SPHN|nr:hypothetical protein [Novosphingobium organovorum]MCJ2182097.1 hypothetical protein [Novosphingobium organovorum]